MLQRHDDHHEVIGEQTRRYQQPDDEQQRRRAPGRAQPEHMDRQQPTGQQGPECPGVRSECAAAHDGEVERVVGPQRREDLARLAIEVGEAEAEHQPGQDIEVAGRDQRVEPEDRAQHDRGRRHEGRAGIDRGGQEGDGQQCVVPPGLHRAGEHHGRAGLQRHDQDQAEDGGDPIGLHPAGPMGRRAAPAERQDAVELGPEAAPAGPAPIDQGLVAQAGEVGQQADRPEDERHAEVADDVDRVPIERAAELGPEVEGVRVGQVPVEEPGPAEMDDRVGGGGRGRDEGAGLGQPVEGAAPFGSA